MPLFVPGEDVDTFHRRMGVFAAPVGGGGGGSGFAGGDVAYADLKAMCADMAATGTPGSPAAGGTLTLGGVTLGSYDYTIVSGNQTIASFAETDWFTSTADTRSAFVVIDGDLTIDSGQTFLPAHRKLFTVVYVTGDVAVAGSISMTGRGANHSGTGVSGGATTAGNILIATGTFSTVVNPKIPAAGAAGGVASSIGPLGGFALSTPNDGAAGSNGATGGGGSGQGGGNAGGAIATGGAGSAGTSFSGGVGGGGCDLRSGGDGSGDPGGANGGAGGNALAVGGGNADGGAGNAGGLGASSSDGAVGSGGVLVVFCVGTLSGSGAIAADGVTNNAGGGRNGGSTGGGSATVLYGTDSSSITPTATGGQGASKGGNGTARKLAL